MALLEKYAPPKSLVQAVQAMTAEQKGHIRELLEAGRTRAREMRKIAEGLMASLPDENQAQVFLFAKLVTSLHLGGPIHSNGKQFLASFLTSKI